MFDPHLPRHDALKVLSADLARDPDFRARFVREADVAAKLDHPNIVSVYNRGETGDGQLWIAMQFVDGTDADAALGRVAAERREFVGSSAVGFDCVRRAVGVSAGTGGHRRACVGVAVDPADRVGDPGQHRRGGVGPRARRHGVAGRLGDRQTTKPA